VNPPLLCKGWLPALTAGRRLRRPAGFGDRGGERSEQYLGGLGRRRFAGHGGQYLPTQPGDPVQAHSGVSVGDQSAGTFSRVYDQAKLDSSNPMTAALDCGAVRTGQPPSMADRDYDDSFVAGAPDTSPAPGAAALIGRPRAGTNRRWR
jgi:hypothetical protein